MGRVIVVLGVIIGLFMASATAAGVPEQLHYSGYLTNEIGEPIDCPDPVQCPVQYTLVFRLYDEASGGNELWEETYSEISIYGGSFHVVLGESNPISAGILDGPVWVGITVNDNAEMVPRQRVVSAAFALRAGSADQADEATNATQLGGVAAIDYASATTVSELQTNLAPVATTGSFNDLVDVPADLADGDDDTQLTEAEVEVFITNEAINLYAGATVDGGTISTGAHTVNTNLTNAEVETSVESSATLNLHPATTIGGQAISTGAHILNTDTQLTEEAVEGYITNSPIDLAPGSTIGGTLAGVVPAGAVMFFNLNACPSGWTELTAARGRYVVGLNAGGSLANTVGSALNNVENRPVGQHGHVVDRTDYTPVGSKIRAATGSVPGGSFPTSQAGNVAGTNAPYIQLLVCGKN
jgi:hypothetical protein